MIIAAGIFCDGVLWTLPPPSRHHHIIAIMHSQNGRPARMFISKGEQGFLDDQGKFLDREKAAYHALKCNQISRLNQPPYLYSEDLW